MTILALPTLLSQVLVAFAIEFDNEAERQLPHRTTNHNSSKDRSPKNNSTKDSSSKANLPLVLHAPWLVSMVMWWNCMKYVDEKGVTVRELESLARIKTNLGGMERWGYVTISPDATDSCARPPLRDWRILATPARAAWHEKYGVRYLA